MNTVKISRLEALGHQLTNNSKIKDFSMILDYDVIIYEGFEMTGKTHLLKLLSNILDNEVVDYRPSYETLDYSHVINRSDRYIHGLHLLDFYAQNKRQGKRLPILFLDRNIHTGIAYGLGLQGKEIDYYYQAINNTVTATDNLNVLVIYKYHPNEASARRMFELAHKDSSRVLDEYDDTDFSNYWKNYQDFDTLFRYAFNKLKFDVLGVSAFCEESEVIVDKYNFPSNYLMLQTN